MTDDEHGWHDDCRVQCGAIEFGSSIPFFGYTMVASKTSAAFFGVGTEEHRRRHHHLHHLHRDLQETTNGCSRTRGTSLESSPALSGVAREGEAQKVSTTELTTIIRYGSTRYVPESSPDAEDFLTLWGHQ